MNSFPRSSRLKRRRLIKQLFDRNASSVIACGCIRLRYAVVPRFSTGADSSYQVGFAPGRQRTKVRRNRLRRIMRETWRTNQYRLDLCMIDQASTLTVMVICKGAGAEQMIRQDLISAMQRLHRILADAQPGGS